MKNILKHIKRFSLEGKVALVILIVFLLLGLLGAGISPYSHRIPSGKPLEAPSIEHLLGTDDLGIDILSQIIHGTRTSLIIGISSALFAGIGGSLIGAVAGYYGGRIDSIVARIIDVFLVIPDLPLIILFSTFLGPSIKNIIIVISILSWTRPARIIRSKVISLKEEDYILVAKSYGASFPYLFKNHFIYGIYPIMVVSIIRLISRGIIAEASLSFLGLGDPTSKSWGLLLHHSINFRGIYYTEFWKWWVMSPLLVIIFFVLSISFVSRDLETVLNEKI